LKKKLVLIVKLTLSLSILAYVVIRAEEEDPALFANFLQRPKNWPMLLLAWASCMLAVLITLVRWYYLVRAIGLPFRLSDALRLGFLGYMFNLVSLGSVGGDLFKGVFIAREHPQHKAAAISTLIVDRMVGLLALLIVGAIAVSVVDLPTDPDILVLRNASLIGTAVCAAVMGIMLLPGFSSGPLAEFFSGLPRVGPTFAQLFGAMRMYRRRPDVLIGTTVMSLGSHGLYIVGIYFLAIGLASGQTASLAQHCVIVPLGWIAGALPLPLSSFGVFEGAIDYLYVHVAGIVRGEGLLVALGYRVITIVIASVGMVFYLRSRREVAEVWQDAEREQESIETQPIVEPEGTA
jgi:uncharacterized membrane protein YbhN (UPF0104 family)